MKRRALLQALPAFAAAGVLPATASPAPEATIQRVIRLQRELSAALAELAADPSGHSYVSVVMPETSARSRVLREMDVYQHDQDRLRSMGRIELAAVEWRQAVAAKDLASAAYEAACAAPRKGPYRPLAYDHPARSAWVEADYVATQTQFALLRTVEDAIAGWV